MNNVFISFSEMFGKKFYGETFGLNWPRVCGFESHLTIKIDYKRIGM